MTPSLRRLSALVLLVLVGTAFTVTSYLASFGAPGVPARACAASERCRERAPGNPAAIPREPAPEPATSS